MCTKSPVLSFAAFPSPLSGALNLFCGQPGVPRASPQAKFLRPYPGLKAKYGKRMGKGEGKQGWVNVGVDGFVVVL